MNEDKATRYHRLKRQTHVMSLVWSVAFLGGLLWSGLTLTLRSGADAPVTASTASGFCTCAAVHQSYRTPASVFALANVFYVSLTR